MPLGLNPIRLSVFLNFYFSNKQISVPFKIFLRTENGNKKVVDRRVKMESTRFKKKKFLAPAILSETKLTAVNKSKYEK